MRLTCECAKVGSALLRKIKGQAGRARRRWQERPWWSGRLSAGRIWLGGCFLLSARMAADRRLSTRLLGSNGSTLRLTDSQFGEMRLRVYANDDDNCPGSDNNELPWGRRGREQDCSEVGM